MRAKEAYVHWNAGVCYVHSYPDQNLICLSRNFRRATRKARNLGYNVRVYSDDPAKAPRDAVKVTRGSFVLPRKKHA